MTAILVFSSPSLVPLRAAFISCWTCWEEEGRSDKEEDMVKEGKKKIKEDEWKEREKRWRKEQKSKEGEGEE